MQADNPAATELQRLQKQTAEPLKNAAMVESLHRSRAEDALRTRGGKAEDDAEPSIFTPEALATAVGASWLLGPAGILLGVGQGLLAKRAQENAIDQFRKTQAAYEDAKNVAYSEFDRMASRATSDEDLAQVQGLQAQYDMASKYIESGDRELMGLGAQMMAQLQTDMADYNRLQETQRIDQEAAAEDRRRTLEQDQLAGYEFMLPRYEEDIDGFKVPLRNIAAGLEALEAKTPLDQNIATFKIQQTIDSLGQVRDEDIDRWSGAQGTMALLSGYANKLAGGDILDADEAADMQSTFLRMQEGIRREWRATDSRYMRRAAEVYALPDKQLADFTQSAAWEWKERVPLNWPKSAVGGIVDAVKNTPPENITINGKPAPEWVKPVVEALSERFDVTRDYFKGQTND